MSCEAINSIVGLLPTVGEDRFRLTESVNNNIIRSEYSPSDDTHLTLQAESHRVIRSFKGSDEVFDLHVSVHTVSGRVYRLHSKKSVCLERNAPRCVRIKSYHVICTVCEVRDQIIEVWGTNVERVVQQFS